MRVKIESPSATVVGRNGHFDLKEIDIFEYGDNFCLQGVNKRNVLNSGFLYLSKADIENLIQSLQLLLL